MHVQVATRGARDEAAWQQQRDAVQHATRRAMFRGAAPDAAGKVAHHPTRGTALEAYPFRLNMYTEPPVQDVTVEEFEGWALDLSLIHI